MVKTDIPDFEYTFVDTDGYKVRASTCKEIVRTLKLDDWAEPRNLVEYMTNVQMRIAVIDGSTFGYWDFRSFLEGYCTITGAQLEVKEI